MNNLIKTFTLSLMGIIFQTISFAQPNTWHQKANYAGSGTYGAFGFSIGQYGYIGGGYDGLFNLNEFFQYNPATNSWTQKSDVPSAVRAASTFVVNGKGYVVGGLVSSSSSTKNLWEYDPVNNVWNSKSLFPGTARYGSAGFAIGNKGYYGIGNAGSAAGPYYTDFYEYDPSIDSWTQKANFPGAARYGIFAIALNGFGYVGFGVNQSSGSIYYNDWYQYNPGSNTWIQKANYTGGVRNYCAGFPLNNKIFVGTGQASTLYNDFREYDPANNSWISKANFGGGARWLMVGFAIGTKGYFGVGYNNVTYYNDFWEYSTDSIQNDTCFTLKPDAIDGIDAIVHSGLPNLNTQPHNELGAVGWTCSSVPCIDRGLIQFDLSSVPPNATITDARLDFYATLNPTIATQAMTGTNACYLQRITQPWLENTVTWNNQPTATSINEIILPQSTTNPQDYLNINVTGLVQDMINNGNYGFMMRLINETFYTAMIFTSSDDPDTVRHPALTVCYTTPSAIYEPIIRDDMEIFPNPFENELNVKFLNSKKHSYQIRVTNPLGQIIFQVSTSSDFINLLNYTSSLKNGIYFIEIISDNKIYSQKITKI